MDVVRISDGLGNQFFQYAFAMTIQSFTGHKVKLDTRFINNEDVVRKGDILARYNSLRDYKLNKFKISLTVASEKELRPWKYIGEYDSYSNNVAYFSRMGLWPFVYVKDGEKNIFEKHFFPTYYSGNFFGSLYYENIKKELQKEFELKEKVKIPDSLQHVLNKKNNVAIHVRRGDYRYRGWNISETGFYANAIQLMMNSISNPVFLVFSDDIDWVRKNIVIPGEKLYVSDMGFRDYEEFDIMKQCKNFIIANSTFSYWAAYLCDHDNKIALYPKGWRSSIIPKEWVSVDLHSKGNI